MRDDVFERLYEEHAQALYGFLRYRTGSNTLTEELLADTFERALRARRRFDPRKGKAKTWLYAIALNCLSDYARRQASERKALERVGTLERVAAGPDQGMDGGYEEIDELADRELDDVADRDLFEPQPRSAERRGARGDRVALWRRPDSAGDRQADGRAGHDGRGARVSRPAQAARRDGLRSSTYLLPQRVTYGQRRQPSEGNIES